MSWLEDDGKLRMMSDQIFQAFDADQTGNISTAELSNVFNQMGGQLGYQVPEWAVVQVAGWYDADGSGNLSEEEFFNATKKLLSMLPQGGDTPAP
eukprot:NODE_4528_length_465_cov_58.466346_g3902_i0.p1 GENE.NODE_4528_length_465_cov_58.466346_g3902_i0~~NODE_4528_length_465_cov_58.466346_g3902_i0.p1  ORF type:complete len:95 (-),score=27.53 NODE_4528_length_465_cov_58.466346_g3902_i0:114-398(-)